MWYTVTINTARPAGKHTEVCRMKTLLKLIAVLAVVAGVLALAAVLLRRKPEPGTEYVTLYGGPDDAED